MNGFIRLAAVAMAVSLSVGCASTETQTTASPKQPSNALKSAVQQDAALRITTAEVMDIVAGTDADNYLFIDSRPEVKYLAGHMPGAISLPKAQMQLELKQLPKDKTLVFYCGGLNCPLSPAAAKIAMDNGFTDVKVWYEGLPGWIQAGNYSIIETKGLQKLQAAQKPFVLIDSRPAPKFQKAFIPGAISIPKAEFAMKKFMLPSDKATPVVFYCGGYHCQLSHQSAKLALKDGYKKVSVYAAGSPAWKEAGLAMWGSQGSTGGTAVATNETISPAELTKAIASNEITVIDVRTAKEFSDGHIPNAIHVFDEDFIYKSDDAIAKLPSSGKVALVCSAGGRASGAYAAIMKTDYANKDNVRYFDDVVSYQADGSYKLGK